MQTYQRISTGDVVLAGVVSSVQFYGDHEADVAVDENRENFHLNQRGLRVLYETVASSNLPLQLVIGNAGAVFILCEQFDIEYASFDVPGKTVHETMPEQQIMARLDVISDVAMFWMRHAEQLNGENTVLRQKVAQMEEAVKGVMASDHYLKRITTHKEAKQ
ncbi:MAG: hypothetical protein HQL90_04085 [Magnetococcales bacterium]|nr:hypothetical protein [Magnetococcales bacterium]